MVKDSLKDYKTAIVCSLGVLLSLSIWFWASQSGPQQAPDVALQFIDGYKTNLHAMGGKPVLVTFWSTSCETCIKKTPELKALYQRLNPRGLEVIAVAMAYDPPNRILAFSKDNAIPYPIALDINGSVAKAFDDVALTPTTFLISPDKQIVLTTIGKLDFEEIEGMLSNMLLKQVPTTPLETS